MRFDTAIDQLIKGDHQVVYHTKCQCHIDIDKKINGEILKVTIRDIKHGQIGEILRGQEANNERIEEMLKLLSLPANGWIPGYSDAGKYNKPEIYFQIIEGFRAKARGEIHFKNVHQLQILLDIAPRVFNIHCLSLIEDHAGIIQETDENGTLRMATWNEALEFSAPLAKLQTMRCTDITQAYYGTPDLFIPMARLYLDAEQRTHYWSIHNHDNGFYMREMHGGHKQFQGNEQEINAFLAMQGLPDGWAATHGYNMSDYERMMATFERDRIAK